MLRRNCYWQWRKDRAVLLRDLPDHKESIHVISKRGSDVEKPFNLLQRILVFFSEPIQRKCLCHCHSNVWISEGSFWSLRGLCPGRPWRGQGHTVYQDSSQGTQTEVLPVSQSHACVSSWSVQRVMNQQSAKFQTGTSLIASLFPFLLLCFAALLFECFSVSLLFFFFDFLLLYLSASLFFRLHSSLPFCLSALPLCCFGFMFTLLAFASLPVSFLLFIF